MQNIHRNTKGAYFPQRYLTDFFKFIDRNRDKLEVITYADLAWGDDDDMDDNYLAELKRWKSGFKAGTLNPDKAYVLIQYDVDSNPERTMSLLSTEAHQGIPANVMIFNNRVDRKLLKNTGVLEYTGYDIDTDLLRSLEAKKFVVGYHVNAMETSEFKQSRAQQKFESDIEELSEVYDIRFYSAHGGVVGEGGIKNRDLSIPEHMLSPYRWVHNGHTVRFKKSLSDGGHNSKKIPPADRDFRDFVRLFQPGERYRLLLHPQYYDTVVQSSPSYGGTPWYDDVLRQYQNESADLWSDVVLFEKE